MTYIHTATEAINALGGTNAVAELFSVDPRIVSMWRRRGLPSKTAFAIGALLDQIGHEFDGRLFAMLEPHCTLARMNELAKSAAIRSRPHKFRKPKKTSSPKRRKKR